MREQVPPVCSFPVKVAEPRIWAKTRAGSVRKAVRRRGDRLDIVDNIELENKGDAMPGPGMNVL